MVLAVAGDRAAATPARRRGSAGKQAWIRFGAKPAVFVACLLPLVWLVAEGLTGGLGANPIEALTRGLGDWALRLLIVTLAISPLVALTGWKTPMQFRRMLGLFAFFYVVLHLLSYVGLDQFFAWTHIWGDVVKRTYITLGMLSFLLLVPLAVTSTKGWIKRLGAARWQALHRLVYPAAILSVVHFVMMVKADLREPAIYAAILSVLLGWRVLTRLRRWRAVAAVRS